MKAYEAMTDHNDVLIVGGGLVGASLACAIAPLGLRISVIESIPLENQFQPSFDGRTVAITWSSRQIFDAIGIWKDIAPEAHPIRSIHVSDRGHAEMVRLNCSLIGTNALGYVIPTKNIGQLLVDRLTKSPAIRYLVPANAKRIDMTSDAVLVHCDGIDKPLSTSLLVIADGGRSPLAANIGITKNQKYHAESALVAMIESSWQHNSVAFERFTLEGPIALLPMEKSRFALAWTLPNQAAKFHLDLTDSEFLTRLQDQFGERAGLFKHVGKRKVHPLRRSSIFPPSAQRTVLVGNAAHELHPVAGQGFNLGLQDVAELAEVLTNAIENNKNIGHSSVIDRYAQKRQRQTKRVISFTEGLVKVFGISTPGAGLLRSIGLNALEICPPAKRSLLRRTAGLSGAQPRLARGVPLTAQRSPHE